MRARKGAYGKVPKAFRATKDNRVAWTELKREQYRRSVGYGATLKWMRIDADMTQRELAKALRVCLQTVIMREQGARIRVDSNIVFQTAQAIARFK